MALCLAENEKLETPEVVTADFVYLRLRKEDYSEEEQAQLATQVKNHLSAGRTVYALFKHEDTPAGAFCAEKLIKAAAL